jgi:hypothetical protein
MTLFPAPAPNTLSFLACSVPASDAIDGNTDALSRERLKSSREYLSAILSDNFETEMKTIQAQEFSYADTRTAYQSAQYARLNEKPADATIAIAAA